MDSIIKKLFPKSEDENVNDNLQEKGEEEMKNTIDYTNENENEIDDGGSSVEIRVFRPQKFEEARMVADYLLNGRIVFINFEKTDKNLSKRIIDYLLGAIFVLRGDLRQVSSTSFIIGPSGVDITGAVVGDGAKHESPEETSESTGFANL